MSGTAVVDEIIEGGESNNLGADDEIVKEMGPANFEALSFSKSVL